DLKFVNDTKHWLLLRTYVGSSSLVVTLYGTPQHRRVESETAPLVTVAPAPIVRTVDKSLAPGSVVVDDSGAPAQSTSVRRRASGEDGKLIYDTTWASHYVASPETVRVGPKPQPKPKPKTKPKPPKKAASPTTPEASEPATTTPAGKPLP